MTTPFPAKQRVRPAAKGINRSEINMDFKLSIANEIIAAANQAFGDTGLMCEEIAAALEIPPNTEMGDYLLLRLWRRMQKPPI